MEESELPFPDRRRHGYVELEQKLEAHVERLENDCDTKITAHARSIEDRLEKWIKRSLIAFSIIGITSMVAIIGYGFVLKSEGEQNEQIQNQRKTFVREECEDVNERNRNSVAALKQEAGEDIANAPTEAVKTEIERRRDVTIALLDTVLPIRNCDELVKLATTGGGNP